MNKNRYSVVQNAENKKDVTLKDAKHEEKTSLYGVTVEQLVSKYDFINMKYNKALRSESTEPFVINI